MEATQSSVFGSGNTEKEERKIYAPKYKKHESVYNTINGIYNDTVEKFLDNIHAEAKEIPLFSYDYYFEKPSGEKMLMHTDVSCRNGNVYIKDNNSERTVCVPGMDTLSRTEAYLTALYLDMGYVDPLSIKVV